MVTRHIAIIPARGGSRRLPNKNILDFMGKPMIAWTIEAALATEMFDRVLVSTDSVEIAKIAIEYGASAPFLRSRAHDDLTPVSQATCASIEQCMAELGETYDFVTQLMANIPLRTSENISDSVQHFFSSTAPAQISCFAFGWMNPWWAVTMNDMGEPIRLFPDAFLQRSQDLPKLYCPSGAIWIARTDALLKNGSFYCPGHRFFPIDWKNALDIDDLEDLEMAKTVFSLLR